MTATTAVSEYPAYHKTPLSFLLLLDISSALAKLTNFGTVAQYVRPLPGLSPEVCKARQAFVVPPCVLTVKQSFRTR